VTIDALADLPDAVASLTGEQRATFSVNARKFSKLVRTGYFTLNAIDRVVSGCGQNRAGEL
jgi:hypothetical protein